MVALPNLSNLRVTEACLPVTLERPVVSLVVALPNLSNLRVTEACQPVTLERLAVARPNLSNLRVAKACQPVTLERLAVARPNLSNLRVAKACQPVTLDRMVVLRVVGQPLPQVMAPVFCSDLVKLLLVGAGCRLDIQGQEERILSMVSSVPGARRGLAWRGILVRRVAVHRLRLLRPALLT